MSIILKINKSWTLFLDRDGVINEKIENDYVRVWEQFVFNENALIAIKELSSLFCRIIIVTNQRGVGKGLMSLSQLDEIHNNMLREINLNLGRIDKIYFCGDVAEDSVCRKPNSGMAFSAQSDFPEINFTKSIMVGDSLSDIQFGLKLGMKTVFIGLQNEKIPTESVVFSSLHNFSKSIYQ